MPAPERLIPDHKYGLWVVQEHLNRYRFVTRYVKRKIVLDAGCGSGYGSYILLRAGASMVYGVDNSDKALKYAKAHYVSPQLRFLRHDLTNPLPFEDKTIDVVVCFETLEHIAGHREFLLECNRILRSGGVIVFSTPNKYLSSPLSLKNPRNPYHLHEFFPDEFLDIVSSVYCNVRCYGQTFPKKIRTGNRYVTLNLSSASLSEFMPRRIGSHAISAPGYIILVGNKKPSLDLELLNRVFDEWKARRQLRIIDNLTKRLKNLRRGDPLATILNIYWTRSDLQEGFPEVRDGNYDRLLQWGAKADEAHDTSAVHLAKHTAWYRHSPLSQIEQMRNELTVELSTLRDAKQILEESRKQVESERVVFRSEKASEGEHPDSRFSGNLETVPFGNQED